MATVDRAGLGWAGLEALDSIRVSHIGVGAGVPEPSSIVFPSTLAGSWIKGWQLNMLCQDAAPTMGCIFICLLPICILSLVSCLFLSLGLFYWVLCLTIIEL